MLVDTEDLLSSEQAADILGWTEGTMRTYRNTGRGPKFVHIGDIKPRVIYLREEVERYKAERDRPNKGGLL